MTTGDLWLPTEAISRRMIFWPGFLDERKEKFLCVGVLFFVSFFLDKQKK